MLMLSWVLLKQQLQTMDRPAVCAPVKMKQISHGTDRSEMHGRLSVTSGKGPDQAPDLFDSRQSLDQADEESFS